MGNKTMQTHSYKYPGVQCMGVDRPMQDSDQTDVDVTRQDKYDLEDAADLLTRGTNTAYVVSKSDVWAVITCGDDYDSILGAAVANRDVVVHKADRADGKISIALEKYADEL